MTGINQKNGKKGYQLKWLLLSVFVVIVDLVSKAWVTDSFNYGERLYMLPVFDLTLLHNTGAAFSFLANETGWQRWFFAVIAVAVSTGLLVWLTRLKRNETWLACALALVLGGALGNLHDRILLGYVVDFLLFHWDNAYFPAFNLADAAITLGAGMLIVDMIRNPDGAKTDSVKTQDKSE
ncbi:signal peptidase II [Oceanospirillum linum]|uniref:Lipoprotein signal peptidase n=1 Tax=Oceanospirillum linum TaxID=966 RepID=A0A1T1HBB6_OCELI|nr:signal peptidase II [Oceanospirillum linum]OOV87139.1 signal peptidase II [Oceanospirillum linum]SEF75834.1 signal peptidase II Aspartic peptidase. MEROPS family A08 [Oleiphilus messinensis]SMP17159.1 signal peptidase II [Oceanospirillum linum]